jgi:hypothetical protein
MRKYFYFMMCMLPHILFPVAATIAATRIIADTAFLLQVLSIPIIIFFSVKTIRRKGYEPINVSMWSLILCAILVGAVFYPLVFGARANSFVDWNDGRYYLHTRGSWTESFHIFKEVSEVEYVDFALNEMWLVSAVNCLILMFVFGRTSKSILGVEEARDTEMK